MDKNTSEEAIRTKYMRLRGSMNERMRRLWAAAEAMALGHGGISLVAGATGLSRTTITDGIKELSEPSQDQLDPQRSRHPGGGRPYLETKDFTLIRDLQILVDPHTRGDPMSPLLWVSKSTRHLASALQGMGHTISHQTVATVLHALGYSLQTNCKTLERTSPKDRDAQFEFINRMVLDFQAKKQPTVSVDTKKKENLGDFKNNGSEWQPEGEPQRVLTTDFPIKEKGKVIPYGVYDMMHNFAWVGVGVDHDTAKFATSTIKRWWQQAGKERHPGASQLLITADGGGSNSSRCRLWLASLQVLANLIGLQICVCHFPPGTSKWNKIEHRLFCYITANWRGRPLTCRDVVVALIAATTTSTGLRVRAELDLGAYPIGVQVNDAEFASVRICRNPFHPEWNYTIYPHQWFVQLIS